MNNFVARALTGFIGAGVVIAVLVSSSFGLLAFCAVVSTLGLWEYSRMMLEDKRHAWVVLPKSLLVWGLLALGFSIQQLIPLLLLYLPIFAILTLFNQKVKDTGREVGLYMLGFLYCFVPMLLFYLFSTTEVGEYKYGAFFPIQMLSLVWFLDTTAYFFGRFLGKHPFFPRISPKKTWEGAIGGGACSILMAVVWHYVSPEADFHWLIIAGIVVIFAPIGDLVESMLKRSVEVKDSGGILPGHGGILDRFDGMYLTFSIVYFYFSLL